MCGAAAVIACAVAAGATLHRGHALAVPLGTACVLFAAFLAFRRWAPLPLARLCVSVVIVLHAFEAVDVSRNDEAAARLRMANALRARGLAGESIAVFVPDRAPAAEPAERKRVARARDKAERVREVLSFYFDRLVTWGGDFAALASDPKVKAIIVEKAALEELRADPGFSPRGGVAALDGGEAEMVLFEKTDG